MTRTRKLSPAIIRQRRGVTKRSGAKPGPKPDPTRRPKRQDTAWQKIRAEQLEREPDCRECARQGRQIPAAEVDHIVALADGGAFDAPDNLQSLCLRHHSQKTEDDNARRGGRKPRRVQLRAAVDPATGFPLPGSGHWWADE
jgi:5-methylcytosine-specific restriction endonuclease McrA